MSTPRISIVLPTYNGQDFLAESIESCLAQTFADFELIIVNDCSTDSTPAIIEAYVKRDPRIRAIHNSPNKKLPGSLNAGFKASRGAYLTWTSDDNYYRPQALERMAAVLDAEPGLDLVYADYTILHHQTGLTEPWIVKPFESITTSSVVQACFLYRRGVYEAIGEYDANLFCAEDYDYWLRAAANGFKLRPLHEDLYVYRWHDKSLTIQKKSLVRRSTIRTISANVPRLRDLPASAAAKGLLHAGLLAQIENETALFRSLYWRAFKTAPGQIFVSQRPDHSPAWDFIEFCVGSKARGALAKFYLRLKSVFSRRPFFFKRRSSKS